MTELNLVLGVQDNCMLHELHGDLEMIMGGSPHQRRHPVLFGIHENSFEIGKMMIILSFLSKE